MFHFSKCAIFSLGAAILFSSPMFTDGLYAQAPAPKPAAGAVPATTEPVRAVPKVIATVNGEDISYQKLANTCVEDYGMEVLERIISRFILELACEEAKVTVTPAEMEAEVKATAGGLGIPVDQYLKMIEEERGISPTIYLKDLVWPQIAARKLVPAEAVLATAEEIQKEFESLYGPALRLRLIIMPSKKDLQAVRQEVLADASKFPALAQKHSTDPYSASRGGLVNEVRRYQNAPAIDEIIFAMKPGEISELIPVGNQFMIVLCEEHLPANPAFTLEKVKDELARTISQAKTRLAGTDFLQKKMLDAKVEVYLNDPVKSAQRPGVVATVNGKIISKAVLANECVSLHGRLALEGLINRTLVEQGIKKRKITVTDADLDKKIASVALESLPPKADGSPDVQQYLERSTQQLGTTVERFRRDAIWPAVALEKLVEDKVVITTEDLQKAYQANFGKKVRCRAILQNNLKRAQQIWAQARENPTEANFMELAKKYSVEAGSAALGGEIPPIQQYSGAPELEKAAFALEEGELSGIIQLEDMFVILLCTGFTEPVGVSFADVKENLMKDLMYKKTEMAIGEEFQKLMDAAAIDNYLTGSSKSPVRPEAAPEAVQPK